MKHRLLLLIVCSLLFYAEAFASEKVSDFSVEPKDSIIPIKFIALGSVSNLGFGGGLRYNTFKHFTADLEISVIPVEGGGFVSNLSLNYHAKANSSFISGLTYARVIIPMGFVREKDFLSPWVGFVLQNFSKFPVNFTLRGGAGYSFYYKDFVVPYVYIGFGLPLNNLLGYLNLK